MGFGKDSFLRVTTSYDTVIKVKSTTDKIIYVDYIVNLVGSYKNRKQNLNYSWRFNVNNQQM